MESTGTVGGLGGRVQSFEITFKIGFADWRLVQPQVCDNIVQSPIQSLGQRDDDIKLGHARTGDQLGGVAPQLGGKLLSGPPPVVLGQIQKLAQSMASVVGGIVVVIGVIHDWNLHGASLCTTMPLRRTTAAVSPHLKLRN